ncbi:hypothetical protein QE374_003144 [Microbacterium sp. SORGH_AS428]|uniref:hypothetical protein n=1 Tax=Microbacterium sp. SORGH_AS_0428 TaxID=3041788 RepID=UPI002856859E|nr:hypothetical protein [Microbacterium sp. SORGH_AS_0428]MDR6201235.1 hypothetical protein [Microbacterium sp. SORGH_AS_0428]
MQPLNAETQPEPDGATDADAIPALFQLRKAAWLRNQVIVPSREAGSEALYALVNVDFWGKGSDPRGEKAAAAAFQSSTGMTLAEIAAKLAP